MPPDCLQIASRYSKVLKNAARITLGAPRLRGPLPFIPSVLNLRSTRHHMLHTHHPSCLTSGTSLNATNGEFAAFLGIWRHLEAIWIQEYLEYLDSPHNLPPQTPYDFHWPPPDWPCHTIFRHDQSAGGTFITPRVMRCTGRLCQCQRPEVNH